MKIIAFGVLVFLALPCSVAAQFTPITENQFEPISTRWQELIEQMPSSSQKAEHESLRQAAEELVEDGDVFAATPPEGLGGAIRGQTKHREPEDPQPGTEDTVYIFIHPEFFAKNFQPLKNEYPHLTPEQQAKLQCDITVLTFLHEVKHADSDSGPGGFNPVGGQEACWEIGAIECEKDMMNSMKVNDPCYNVPGSPMHDALCQEIDDLCAFLHEMIDWWFLVT